MRIADRPSLPMQIIGLENSSVAKTSVNEARSSTVQVEPSHSASRPADGSPRASASVKVLFATTTRPWWVHAPLKWGLASAGR